MLEKYLALQLLKNKKYLHSKTNIFLFKLYQFFSTRPYPTIASHNSPAEDEYLERILNKILKIDWGFIKINPLNFNNVQFSDNLDIGTATL